jgi:L-alanine-DL-glutamate epimerase-like enolase superfamily enzyme
VSSQIQRISLYRLRLPLHVPYRLSYHTFEAFEPILVGVADGDGRVGWGEAHISPGSSAETRAGGWDFCRDRAAAMLGQTSEAAKDAVGAVLAASPVAAGALIVALEMLEDHPLLRLEADVALPLLTPTNGWTEAELAPEIAGRLEQGFATFKVKVGQDVDADLARVAMIQRLLAGRATLRLDANRAYTRDQGCRFAAALDPAGPAGIELFEQPCAAEDWEANGAVAAASAVPLMLDEAICSLEDIERAATLPGVGFCKLKLKRFGGLERLTTALQRVRALGMEPVLGDGLSSDLGCWMEACVARSTIRNAGEFNGFLKPKSGVFTEPLGFEDGRMVLAAGFRPRIDPAALADKIVAEEIFDLSGA